MGKFVEEQKVMLTIDPVWGGGGGGGGGGCIRSL